MKYRHNFTQHLSMNSTKNTHCCRTAFVRLTLLPVFYYWVLLSLIHEMYKQLVAVVACHIPINLNHTVSLMYNRALAHHMISMSLRYMQSSNHVDAIIMIINNNHCRKRKC